MLLRELAVESGISYNTIIKLERGRIKNPMPSQSKDLEKIIQHNN
ncbi:MAG TPA: helix-turn-helix domain-containing protein [Candidatus Omnitrophica bacterium]|nr:helix-turn-helix domain-containing protein [Candidatus Omnitrophota bacterium]